jgi:hypothetical protein
MITAATISAGLALLTAAGGWVWSWWSNRYSANNTPAMQAAAANQKQVSADDKVKADVESANTPATQEDLQ